MNRHEVVDEKAVKDEATEAKPSAKMFYISYRRTLTPGDEYNAKKEAGEDVPESNYPDATKRPITFSFNGGPGSSSVCTSGPPMSTRISSTMALRRNDTIWSDVNAEKNMPMARHVAPMRTAPR